MKNMELKTLNNFLGITYHNVGYLIPESQNCLNASVECPSYPITKITESSDGLYP